MKPIPFGKYSLLHRIDTGGMAEVFRAKAFGVEGFERIVAVKRILPNIAADTDFITMFIDEAKLAVQLTHANIAQIFDLGRVGDSYFIALEYVHGKDLRAVFEHARETGEELPIDLVCYVMMKICEGLDYAHEKSDPMGSPLELVHRDISPQNMLISFEGDVKLIDFGIAKAANKASRTRTGILKGKFGYLSPEQVRGEQVDRRSDVFGVGIVLHELLTLERLFVADSEFSTIEKVRKVEISSPRDLNPAVPRELADIVMRALARERERRYQSALELHDALQNFLHARGEPFHRKELSGWMHAQFPDDAARDLEQVGDLEGAETLAFHSNDVAPSVQPTESSAVYKETRDAPEEAKPKHPSTILGMPAVLPPADLAISTPSRPSMPPPPPRGGRGPGSRPPVSSGRTAPPPPPRSAAAELHEEASSPMHAVGTPSAMRRSVPPPPPSGPSQSPATLSMDWDDEELSTQIYDRPNDDYESVEGGFDDVSSRGEDDSDHAFDQAYQNAQQGYEAEQQAAYGAAYAPQPQQPPQPQRDPFAPQGVHVAQGAFGEPPAAHRVEPLTSMRAPSTPSLSQTMTMATDRPSDRRNPLFVALGVAAVMMLCFTVYVFLARTEPGTVHLTTHPADAVVMFDGKQVGSLSPFVITGVSPNDKHIIEVKKPGYRPWSQEVQVQAGQPLQFPVTLQPEGGDAVAVGATAATQTGGFSIETSPPGAAVFLDNQELSGVTPLRVGNLLPRAYDLRVKLSGFREHTTRVDVRSGVDRSLPRVVLEAERVHVRIASEPAGAEAVLVRGSEQRTVGRTPIDVTLDNDGQTWSLQVSKSGFEPFTQTLKAEPGAAELSVRAVLARKERDPEATQPVAEAPRAASSSSSSSSNSSAGSSPAPRAAAPSAAATAAAAPSEGGAPGTLRINSRPWSQVFVDGRNIGNTPQMNVQLPAGTHRVMLVNPEFNLRKTVTINIRSGQVETQIIALQ